MPSSPAPSPSATSPVWASPGPTARQWPSSVFGYTARNQLGTTVLVDEKGKVVAKVGDEISVGGGFRQPVLACVRPGHL